ncbi:hypothetical protein WM32_08985 [Burkholderia ubonensis]|uniref:hypothetical protein n=1 Tax=Burkholderia ubonensis TaxID=101571 RepID=UPI0007547C08|nr:hypothetical protein [Burkholderia ubonensis]KWO88572.1 hypothetical protein WM32_08985 [Burkholderia ubonensis]
MSTAVLVDVRTRLVDGRRMSDLSNDDERDIAELLDAIDDELVAIRDNATWAVDAHRKSPRERLTVTLAHAVLHLEDNYIRDLVRCIWRQLIEERILT